jgi:hypothetical protein
MPDFEFPRERLVVEAKEGLTALRDFRDALVRLIQQVDSQPSWDGCLLLIDPGISQPSLRREFETTRQALRPDLAARVHLVTTNDGVLTGGEWDLPMPFEKFLREHSSRVPTGVEHLPRPDMQAEVFRFVLLQWFLGRGPMTAGFITEEVGCNYRTVVQAIAKLGTAIRRGSDRSIELQRFPREAWNALTVTGSKIRHTQLYIDHSDQPRSVESLYQRIAGLQRSDIAFGGLVGARVLDPTLDIVGTPRLDICLHAFGKMVEPLPPERIDPGLRPANEPGRPARVAVHFLRRRASWFTERPDGTRTADPVECALDIMEAGFTSQAESFLSRLEAQRGTQRGN